MPTPTTRRSSTHRVSSGCAYVEIGSDHATEVCLAFISIHLPHEELPMRKTALHPMPLLVMSLLAAEAWSQPPPAAPAEDHVSADLISRADALKIAEASLASCERQSETAAAFVTDADGYLRAALSSDSVNPIGLHTASL